MDQARAHATGIAQRLSPRDSTDTHRRRGREELQEELQEEHRNQVDVFRKVDRHQLRHQRWRFERVEVDGLLASSTLR